MVVINLEIEEARLINDKLCDIIMGIPEIIHPLEVAKLRQIQSNLDICIREWEFERDQHSHS